MSLRGKKKGRPGKIATIATAVLLVGTSTASSAQNGSVPFGGRHSVKAGSGSQRHNVGLAAGAKTESWTGEQIVDGLFFGRGPVAALFPEFIADVPPASREDQETLDRVMERLRSDDATFFERFREAMESGDHLVIRRELRVAAERIWSTLLAESESDPSIASANTQLAFVCYPSQVCVVVYVLGGLLSTALALTTQLAVVVSRTLVVPGDPDPTVHCPNDVGFPPDCEVNPPVCPNPAVPCPTPLPPPPPCMECLVNPPGACVVIVDCSRPSQSRQPLLEEQLIAAIAERLGK